MGKGPSGGGIPTEGKGREGQGQGEVERRKAQVTVTVTLRMRARQGTPVPVVRRDSRIEWSIRARRWCVSYHLTVLTVLSGSESYHLR